MKSKVKVQLKNNYCEVTMKSDYGINQKVEFKEGISHPLYSDKTYSIKDIRFNENLKQFEYLLETEDFSRFWKNQEDIQMQGESAKFTISGDSINFIDMNSMNMNSGNEYRPVTTYPSEEFTVSGFDSLSSFYLNNNLKSESVLNFTDCMNSLTDITYSPLTIDSIEEIKYSEEEVKEDEKSGS